MGRADRKRIPGMPDLYHQIIAAGCQRIGLRRPFLEARSAEAAHNRALCVRTAYHRHQSRPR
jgi:hypothetical protein